MTATVSGLTLVGLQRKLDSLEPGDELMIAGSTGRRLFGLNDAASARIDHFATGHGCTVIQYEDVILFHKRG